jgi:hypothetical protein
MTDKPKRIKVLKPTPDELKPIERAKANHAEQQSRGIFFNVKDGIDKTLKSLTKTDDYEISTFYKPELVAQALDKLKLADKVSTQTKDGKTFYVDQKAVKLKLTDNIGKLQAFYDKHQQDYITESTRYFTLRTAKGKRSYLKEIDELAKYFTEVDQTIKDKDGKNLTLKGYTVSDPNALSSAIKQLKLPTYTSYEIVPEPSGSTDIATFTNSMRQVVELADECDIPPEGGAVMQVGDTPVHQVHLQLHRIINDVLAGVKDLAKAQPISRTPDQIDMFSNIAMGVDTAEITGRHQFFSPMFRGFMNLGEQGLYEAIQRANKGSKQITIPYETKGSNSVYRTKMQTEVQLSGHNKQLVTTQAEADRFVARLIKAQGILYLWAMHTNSMTIYNTKITDMLRLVGYEGRIKQEHYTDVTEGIAGLFSITLAKTDDHYTDPKTGKKIYVGKNEMYGEVIRPIGDLQAIWHTDKDSKPVYIKKVVRLRIADGMLNPNQRRATLISKALLRLNTLQERQYLQLGSFISDHFSQYQDSTIEGKPIKLTVQTLLEWRGLATADNYRRVDQTKTYLRQALDKLVAIGHIAKWRVDGADYDQLGLSPDDRQKTVLIYPTEHIKEALKGKIADQDEPLKKILKKQVKERGVSKVAQQYDTSAEAIQKVVNNRDTVDSLPSKAYNNLKAQAYDSGKK